jgi:hypothetical protein
MPASKTKRAALGADYARDGAALLRAVWDPWAPAWLAHLPAVEVLRRVLIHNVVVDVDRGGRAVIRPREADTDGLPPGRCRIVSPDDTDARWAANGPDLERVPAAHQRVPQRRTAHGPVDDVGDAPPNLITNVATTNASMPDVAVTEPIHADLQRRQCCPPSTPWTPATRRRTCGVQPDHLRVRLDTRCWPTPPRPAPGWLGPHRVHRRLADGHGHLPQGKTNASWTPAPSAAPRSSWRSSPASLPSLPGQIPVHHRHPRRPATDPAAPTGAAGP